MADNGSDDPWDDDEEEHDADDSLLGALDFSTPDDEPDVAATQTMFFTVTNPPGTVSVTALMDGRPIQVELGPQVAKMTEDQLAEEISLIARLASQNALAGQHVLVAGMMRQMGHDPLTGSSYVEHELGLPSAGAALAEKAQIFANRYYDGED